MERMRETAVLQLAAICESLMARMIGFGRETSSCLKACLNRRQNNLQPWERHASCANFFGSNLKGYSFGHFLQSFEESDIFSSACTVDPEDAATTRFGKHHSKRLRQQQLLRVLLKSPTHCTHDLYSWHAQ